MALTKSERAWRYIERLPKALSGQGGHNATFRTACVLLHGFDLPAGEARALLGEWNLSHCDPQWSEHELDHKINSASSHPSTKPKGYLLQGAPPANPRKDGVAPPPRRREEWIPDYDEKRLREFVRPLPDVDEDWFIQRSPIDPRSVTPGEYLEHTFAPSERVLIFTNYKSQGDFAWVVGSGGCRLSPDRGVKAIRSKIPTDGRHDGIWYLCQPVDGKWHPNPRSGGKYSRRSAESVTDWRHLVLESDEAPPGLWLRLLAMSPLRIKAIYSSGGRSWHALALVDEPDKASFDALLRNKAKRILPIFGADPGAMTPVRLTRLPGCTRNGRLQRLIYLNPTPHGRIIDEPPVRNT